MTQNLIDLSFSEEQLRAIDGAIAVLEANLGGLIALSAAQRMSLQKMGSTGEPFCRDTLSALVQNPQIVPPSLGLSGAQADLRALDQLRPRGMRLKVLAGRVEDSEMALGSDVFAVARVGYKLIGAIGGDQGLKGARRELAPRYYRPKRGGRAAKPED